MTHTVTPSDDQGRAGRLDDLLHGARVLWPPPHSVVYATAPPAPRAHQGHIVLPNPSAARLCVPADNPRAAAAAMLRFSSALRGRDVAARVGAAAAIAAGLGPVLRHRLVVRRACDTDLASHLGELLGSPVSLSFGIGAARVNRKPVIGVFDARGTCLAYAKAGVDPFSDAQVSREARALRQLQGLHIPGVLTPRALHFSTWEHHPLLLMTALQPSAWATMRRGRRPPAKQMADFGAAFGVQERPLSSSTWWQSTLMSIQELPQHEARTRLQQCIDVVGSRWADTRVRLGAWHGDWTPWNMGWHRGRLMLWDLERFELGAPLGLDALHYAVNAAPEGATTDPRLIVRRILDTCRRLDRSTAALLGAVYLLSITTRYRVAAHTDNGHLIDARADAMLRALEEWLTGREVRQALP